MTVAALHPIHAGATTGPTVVAEVVRSGFVEGHHYGSVVSLDRTGAVDWSLGPVDVPILPRSCAKPIQAVAMLRAGLELPADLLALACASHSGEDFHITGVRRILAEAGLTEAALRTPPDFPLDDAARVVALRAGLDRAPVWMSCSGKHAAMLATCVVNGWDVASYLAPDHPLQQAILRTHAELTGTAVDTVVIDGCGAPMPSTTLTGLATAFHRIALGRDGHDRPDAASAAVAAAIRRHPANVSGTTRDELALLTAVPGAIGKLGAEACYVVALPDGRSIAVKIDDGADRARPVVMAAALERLGVLDDARVDAARVRRTGRRPLLGGGREVGEVRARLPEPGTLR